MKRVWFIVGYFLVIFSFWLTYITHIFFNLFENKMKLKDTCSKYEN